MNLRIPATLRLTLAWVAGGVACSLACSSQTPGGVSDGAGHSTTGAETTATVTASSASTLGGNSSSVAVATTGTVGTMAGGTVGSGGAGSTGLTTAGIGAATDGGSTDGGSTNSGTTDSGTTGGGAGGSTGGGAGGVGGGSTGGGVGGSSNDRPARVLLYSFSTLDIPSVPAQLDIFEEHLAGWGYEVDRSTDPAVFTDTSLANYAAVGMINTCFSPFGADNATGDVEAQALQRFLQDGGGLFGTHCADVTFQSANPPVLYNQILGGRASSENFEGVSDCRRTSEHPAAVGLAETFTYNGNLDNTNFLADDIEILVRCTWGNPAATDIVVSWVRNEGPGRVFFTNFAKVDTDLTNATIGEPHIIAGLGWVLGRLE